MRRIISTNIKDNIFIAENIDNFVVTAKLKKKIKEGVVSNIEDSNFGKTIVILKKNNKKITGNFANYNQYPKLKIGDKVSYDRSSNDNIFIKGILK